MAMGRPVKPVIVTSEARVQLESMVRSRSLPHPLVRRAKIVLFAADGMNNKEISEKLAVFWGHGGNVAQAFFSLKDWLGCMMNSNLADLDRSVMRKSL